MAGSYNRVILVGNLTHDPEMHYTANGTAVCNFRIGSNNRRYPSETLFIDIVAWDNLAEICTKQLRQGASVLIEGRLVIRSHNGQSITEIVIDNMQKLDARKESDMREDRPSRLMPADRGTIDTDSARDTRDDVSQGDTDEMNRLIFGD